MQVVWTPGAVGNLRHIREYIADDSPRAAARVSQTILDNVEQLSIHPNLGRAGREPGTRELMIPGTPYFIVYAVRRSSIEVYAVLHGAQEPRPRYYRG